MPATTAATTQETSTLRLNRTFAAPRDKVFHAWTDPKALKQWWGPPGYIAPSAEVDLREGGRYRIAMQKLPDGEIFYLTGSFIEVRRPERLVYTWRWESEPEKGETLVTVEFRDRGKETEISLTHQKFPSDDAREKHNHGWNGCLDRLAEFVKKG